MFEAKPEIIFMSECEFQEACDQYALNQYLIAQSQEKYGTGVANFAYYKISNLIHESLSKLPEQKRQLIHLKYWLDLSEEEIAKKLGLTFRKVKKLLSDVLLTLKHAVTESLNQPQYAYAKSPSCLRK